MGEAIGKFIIKNDTSYSITQISEKDILTDNSVYEVIRIINGVPLFWESHFDRFQASIRGRNFDIDTNRQYFKSIIIKTILANNFNDGNIKIVYNIINREYFAFFIRHDYPQMKLYYSGVDVSLLQLKREDPSIKLVKNYYKKTTTEYRKKTNTYEVILYDENGDITEGSRSNVFFIKENIIYSAPSTRVLIGITLQKIYEICKTFDIQIVEKTINKRDLNKYDSIFLTGTSTKVLPVKSIEKNYFDINNKVLNTLIREYDNLVENYLYKFQK
ncbi:aminotransferase class IV [Clostridium sp. DL1XJH146]